jgi:parallel beta-helix repeat protein
VARWSVRDTNRYGVDRRDEATAGGRRRLHLAAATRAGRRRVFRKWNHRRTAKHRRQASLGRPPSLQGLDSDDETASSAASEQADQEGTESERLLRELVLDDPSLSHDMPLIRGTALGHFIIGGLLGRGGMGAVYRAKDPALHRDVAVKVLPSHLAHDPERRSLFLREARSAAAVSHANIAMVHEVGEADGRVFIGQRRRGNGRKVGASADPAQVEESPSDCRVAINNVDRAATSPMLAPARTHAISRREAGEIQGTVHAPHRGGGRRMQTLQLCTIVFGSSLVGALCFSCGGGSPSGMSASDAGTDGPSSRDRDGEGPSDAGGGRMDGARGPADVAAADAEAGAEVEAAPSSTVLLTSFGSVCAGGDDTAVFQTAINSTAKNGQILEIPAGDCNIRQITLPTGANVQCDPGVTISDYAPLAGLPSMIEISGADHVVLKGPNPAKATGSGGNIAPSSTTCVFRTPKTKALDAIATHVIRVGDDAASASDVTISGITAVDGDEDGIYVRNASHVTVSNCTFSGNGRNGGSLTGLADHVAFSGNYFGDQHDIGGGIADGFDVEPNCAGPDECPGEPAGGDFVTNLSFEGNYFVNNTLSGLAFQLSNLWAESTPISITITGNHASGNGGNTGISGDFDYWFVNNDDSNGAVGGTIVGTDNDSSGSAFAGVAAVWCGAGASLKLTRTTIDNPYALGTTDEHLGGTGAVFVRAFGGADCTPGNVHFVQTTVDKTSGPSMQYYFDFTGSNVSFDLKGTLTGRSGSTNGVYNGSGVSSVP